MNKMTDKVTKLFITDSGDPSVGIFPCTWTVEVPFAVNDAAKKDYNESSLTHRMEELKYFKEDMILIYSDYCDGKCTAYYDFENTDDGTHETAPPKKESKSQEIQQWEHLLDTKI